MIYEVEDKNSGAILFKEDEETRLLKSLKKRVSQLEEKLRDLEDEINSLKSK